MSASGKIIVTLSSEEKEYQYEDLSLTFDDSAADILQAVDRAITESEGTSLFDEDGSPIYTINKVEVSQNVYVVPKSVAGWLF